MAHLPQIRVLCDEAAEVMLREGIHTDGDDIYEYILHVIENRRSQLIHAPGYSLRPLYRN